MNHIGQQMSTEAVVYNELQQILSDKGLSGLAIRPESVLLGDEMGLDSLDLATLVVALEERTGLRPFEKGFVMFKTVAELVGLFSKS
jgi:acyl carrier protein